MKSNILMMHILDVHTSSPFKDLFKIDPAVLKSIAESMKIAGFDMVHPLVLWAGHQSTLVDGHTRLQAAKDAGLLNIPVVTKEFATEVDALEYAISSQRNRRNLTEAEMFSCIHELDKRKSEGRPPKTATGVAVSGRSSEQTAKLLKTSRSKVEKIRTINDHGSEEIKAAVGAGDMTVNAAYNKILADRHRKSVTEERSPEEIGLERTETIKKEIVVWVKKRLESEAREYPDVEYSDENKEVLATTLSNEIRQLLYGILPHETISK